MTGVFGSVDSGTVVAVGVCSGSISLRPLVYLSYHVMSVLEKT